MSDEVKPEQRHGDFVRELQALEKKYGLTIMNDRDIDMTVLVDEVGNWVAIDDVPR